jgi:hypothetical protein
MRGAERIAMRAAWLALAAIALLLPGLAQAQTANPANDALVARGQTAMRDEFRNIIRRSGHACMEVAAMYPAGQDQARTAYWDVACRDSGPWRISLKAERFTAPVVTACNAPGGPPAGPCLRPVGAAAPQVAQPPSAGGVSPQCRTACQSQPQAVMGACLQRCAAGGSVQQASLPSGAAAVGRFGFIYVGEPPATAFGFDSGKTDRLAASMNALRACESVIGRNQCRLALDFPNACGALAQALSSQPVQVRRLSTGTGQSISQAEAQALSACRIAEVPGSAITCRIAASGC